ncbi:MAG: hypothetical protein ABL970_00920 [Nitrospira sp.]
MTAELKMVSPSLGKPTAVRGRIQQLEQQPSDDWFVTTRTPRGGTRWYCRFRITGLHPRVFGPFPSKRKAVLFLDGAIGLLGEFWTNVDDIRDRYANEGEFERVNWGPLIEYPFPYFASQKKGQ